MFWKGRLSAFSQLSSYFRGEDVTLSNDLSEPSLTKKNSSCRIVPANRKDAHGIVSLLNEWFEPLISRSQVSLTTEWFSQTFLKQKAIWIVAKDSGGTIRGCIGSFSIHPPYMSHGIQWGIIDWFCVHPLWREKGVGSDLLCSIDYITYKIGRRAHVFLKEGLPLFQLPVYCTFLKVRRAGNREVHRIKEQSGLQVFPYFYSDKETNLPLLRVEGLRGTLHLEEWENALDNELPACFVFVNGSACVSETRGWKQDSLVCVYAFRWNPGKWLGTLPSSEII
jgi:hypothetical protein